MRCYESANVCGNSSFLVEKRIARSFRPGRARNSCDSFSSSAIQLGTFNLHDMFSFLSFIIISSHILMYVRAIPGAILRGCLESSRRAGRTAKTRIARTTFVVPKLFREPRSSSRFSSSVYFESPWRIFETLAISTGETERDRES